MQELGAAFKAKVVRAAPVASGGALPEVSLHFCHNVFAIPRDCAASRRGRRTAGEQEERNAIRDELAAADLARDSARETLKSLRERLRFTRLEARRA